MSDQQENIEYPVPTSPSVSSVSLNDSKEPRDQESKEKSPLKKSIRIGVKTGDGFLKRGGKMSIPSGISTLIFGFQWDYYHPVIIYNPDSETILHDDGNDDDDDDDENDNEAAAAEEEEEEEEAKLSKFYEEQRERLSRTMLDLDVEGSCIVYGKDGTHLDEITQRRPQGQMCGDSIRFVDDTVAQYRVKGNILQQPSTLWCLGDDQQIVLDLNSLNKSIETIVFAVTLTVDRKQDLSLLKSLGCRLLTHPGPGGNGPVLELCRFAISCKSLLNVNAILLGRLERIDKCVDRNSWEFITMAEPIQGSTVTHAIQGFGQGRPRTSAATEVDKTIYVYAPQDAQGAGQPPVSPRQGQEKQSTKKRFLSLHTSIRDSITSMKLSSGFSAGGSGGGPAAATATGGGGGGGGGSGGAGATGESVSPRPGGASGNFTRSARGPSTGTQGGKGGQGNKEDCLIS